jgi:acetolactate synthase-1/2/3 large subunit
MATSGPGATNLVTGIATAFMDSSPIVAITGQVPRPFIGKDAFQETDIIGVVSSITKYTFQPRRAADIPKAIKAAFHIATTKRPGPVLVDLARDVQQEVEEMDFQDALPMRGYRPAPEPDPILTEKISQILIEAKTPMILAGGGVKISGASPELVALAELLSAPVVTSLMGKGVISEDHPLSLGVIGMHGSSETNALVPEADVLLIVGSRLSDRTTGNIEKFCPKGRIIHVDIDNAEIGKNKKPAISMVCDAKKGLGAIYAAVQKRLTNAKRDQWFRRNMQVQEEALSEERKDGPYLSAVSVIKLLRKLLPRETIVTTEVGQNQMWCLRHFKVYGPRTFISSGGLGTMGFGFPAALGAKVACPNVPVVDIAGDGSFGMTENSLATSIEEQIPVIVVILNNRMLGMVAQWHRLFYGRRYIAVELGKTPDFVKLAEAYGAHGISVADYDELAKAVKSALTSDITTVIDVPISPEEDALPLLPPGRGLGEVDLA